LTETKEAITDKAIQECRCRPVEPGTLLFSFKLTIGKMAFAGRRLFTNEAIAALPVKAGVELDARFLALALKVVPLLGEASDAAKGTTLNKKSLSELQIPVPPLAEQRRLVTRIEALTRRAHELMSLNSSLVEDASRLLGTEYGRITRNAPMRRFGDIAKLIRRRVVPDPDEPYPELGIRSFGKGTFHKPSLTGRQLGNKRVFRIRTGDLVFMNVFAWEGAIAVARPEDDERVGSHRFMAHEVDVTQATVEFLCYHLLTDQGLEHIRAASPGSAGRNRTLGITKLHAIPVPVPPIEAQQRFSKLYVLRESLRRLHAETEAELKRFTPALLAKAFRGEL
jgi:type I restriction enzyme S subunit